MTDKAASWQIHALFVHNIFQRSGRHLLFILVTVSGVLRITISFVAGQSKL